jgi:F0F1-type ATP synthase membrane subunit b/b'
MAIQTVIDQRNKSIDKSIEEADALTKENESLETETAILTEKYTRMMEAKCTAMI